jgi:hypothetical protein
MNIKPSASSFSDFDATISFSWQRSRACKETNMNIRFNRKEKNGYASNMFFKQSNSTYSPYLPYLSLRESPGWVNVAPYSSFKEHRLLGNHTKARSEIMRPHGANINTIDNDLAVGRLRKPVLEWTFLPLTVLATTPIFSPFLILIVIPFKIRGVFYRYLT